MSVIVSNNYNVSKISCNLLNNYRYVYVDSIDGDLTMKNNWWYFTLNFYLILNGNLPMNMLEANITSSFATVNNISLNRNPYAQISGDVVQKDQCQVYQASFNIDTSNNKFFDQMITSYQMYLTFTFGYNAEVVDKNTFNNETSSTNLFLNEWILQNQQMSLLYSNYIKVSDNEGWFDNGSSYYLTTKNGCYSRQAAVIYTMNNDCEELKKPIVHLLSLQTNTPACIIGYRANFYYSINSECKIYEYHYDNKDIAPIHGHYDLDFHVITSYDDSTKSVNTNLIGNYGFYIPTRSAGYFEIEVKIEQNDYVRTYCFHKNFSFSSETHYDRNINITPIMIDTITSDYKRMTF